MKDTFFISDQHYSHANILNFTGDDGNLIRPGFAHVDEMNERMIEAHNAVVTDNDDVYMLGDFVWGKNKTESRSNFHNIVRRLKGNIKLLFGNHDALSLDTYAERYPKFEVLTSSLKQFGRHTPKFWISHAPLHLINLNYVIQDKEGQPKHQDWFNVHGHIHQRHVLNKYGTPDLRYVNVSVECINYTPVSIDELLFSLTRPNRRDAWRTG